MHQHKQCLLNLPKQASCQLASDIVLEWQVKNAEPQPSLWQTGHKMTCRPLTPCLSVPVWRLLIEGVAPSFGGDPP